MKVTLKHAVRIKRGKGHKMLEPGTEADLSEAVANDLIEKGAAERLDIAPAQPVQEEGPDAEPGG